MEQALQPSPLIKLAAMECAASSVMEYLHRIGCDYRTFLLEYWNLNYMANLLTSGKHIRFYSLDVLFGVSAQLCRSDANELHMRLARGQQALLMCRPSGLPFFPREMLMHEGLGYEHVLLVCGCDEEAGAFRVVDSVADFEGLVSAGTLAGASAKPDELHYYALTAPDGDFAGPSPQELFAYVAARNLAAYDNDKNVNSGSRALDMFARTLAESAQWEPARRDAWIDQNNVTVSSIIKTRQAVWESFCALGVLGAGEVARGTQEVQAIVKLWTLVNFFLIKYKRKPSDAKLTASLQGKLAEIKAAELCFLQRLAGRGECGA